VFALDSNVLVYAADKRAQAKHVAASNIVHAASGAQAALTEQSIMEFVNATTRKVRLPFADVLPFVREFQRNFELLLPTRTIVDDVLALLSRHQLSVFDARILAICGAHGCDYLLSEDLQDGARYGSVTVLNPFAPANSNLVAGLLMP
jgi:predicted nucleic acid-binding protein